ncbi:MAG: hypothetical protein ACTS6J_09970 [Burkholderiales bacterium]
MRWARKEYGSFWMLAPASTIFSANVLGEIAMRNHSLFAAAAMLICVIDPNPAMAQTQVSVLCSNMPDADLVALSSSPAARAYISAALPVLPGGSVTTVDIPGTSTDDMVFCARLLPLDTLQAGNSTTILPPASPGVAIEARPSPQATEVTTAQQKVAPYDRRNVEVMATRQRKAGDGTPFIRLDLRIPDKDFGPQEERKLVIASFKFDQKSKPLESISPAFLAWKEVRISDRWFAFTMACLVTLFAYALSVLAQGKGLKRGLNGNAQTIGISFSPVFITSDRFGRASLSRFQVFSFTLIVIWLLTYILFRTNVLSDISSDVLKLLGISAAGAVGAKITEVLKSRLSFENWSWLRNQGWLVSYEDGTRKNEKPPLENAKWSDLLRSDNSFDIYSFQLATVSIVVAVALLNTDLNELSKFQIPQNLLQLLGLSNLVFIGGKAIGADTFKDLDAKVGGVMQAEIALKAKIAAEVEKLAPEQKKNPADVLNAAKAVPDARKELEDYLAKAQIAARMLKSVFPEKGDTKFESDNISDESLMPKFAPT